MKFKQKLAALLVVLLIGLHAFPAFAVPSKAIQEPVTAKIAQKRATSSDASGNQEEPSEEEPSEEESSKEESSKEEPSKEPENVPSNPVKKPASSSDASEDEAESPELEEVLADSEKENEIPIFTAELVTDGNEPGIFGTLSYIPENAMDIVPEYSFGGESYYFMDEWGGELEWELDPLSPGDSALTQLCMRLEEHPYTAWEKEEVNSLYIRLNITCMDSDDIRTEPVLFSHQKTYPIPETPPPFTAELKFSYGGYSIEGHFEHFPPDVIQVRPMYSLNGEDYEFIGHPYFSDWSLENMGAENEEDQYFLENQCCSAYDQEPLASYVAGKLERFYVRLAITTESGVYYTQADVIERGVHKPIPEGATLKAVFPFTMFPLDEWGSPLDVPYGQYQITVREGIITSDTLRTLLPDTLPVEVQIVEEGSGEKITSGIVPCRAVWKTPSSLRLAAGQSFAISDAVEDLEIPSGTEVQTPLGSYTLPSPLTFSGSDGDGEVRLVLDAVGKKEGPDVSLRENSWENTLEDIGALSLAFRLKPSGAESIKAYSFIEGEEDWTELCDLLTLRDLNHNQAMGLYGFITLLQPEDSPFREYLRDESPFLIGLKIEGGTFDGETVVLPWPGDYDPPLGIPEPGGSEGNENNAGSGNGNGGGNNSGGENSVPDNGDNSNRENGSNGGQRPNLSDEKQPSIPEWSTAQISENLQDAGIISDSFHRSASIRFKAEAIPADQSMKEPPAMEESTIESEHRSADLLPVESYTTTVTPKEADITEAANRPLSKNEKTGGLPTAAAVLFLGGGITAVAVVGSGGAATGGTTATGAAAKLLTILKKLFTRLSH